MRDQSVESYVIPAVSSRRGVLQGLLVLTGVYVIGYGLTEADFFGDAFGFSLAALLIVAAARFLPVEHPIMRIVTGLSLAGAFLLGAAVTESSTTMAQMGAAGLAILVASFVLLTPGRAEVGVRGITARRLLRKTTLSYDEIAAVSPRRSRLGLIKGQVGFGSPNVALSLFSGGAAVFGIAPEDLDRFFDEMSQQVEPAEDDNFFIPATSTPPSRTTTPPAPRATRPEPAADQRPAAPRSQGRGRQPGDAP